MRVKRKHLNDLVIYLQKTYGLYFVEFRRAPNGRRAIVLCHPNNKHWWINITILNIFEVFITIGCAGKDNCMKELIMNDIYNHKYVGYETKLVGKWLRL